MGMISLMTVNSVYFGICYYVQALLDDVIGMLNDMNATAEKEKPIAIKNQFREAILFHGVVIGWVISTIIDIRLSIE